MHRPILALAALIGLAAQARADFVTIDFEQPPLAQGTAYSGADGAGGFTSGGAFFNNTFTDFGGGFTAYSGWFRSNLGDTTTPGFLNQFSAFPGSGAGGSAHFAGASAFAPGDAFIDLPDGFDAVSGRFTNTTYAALSMLQGDQFAKKFGGPSGLDPDFFRLTITGYAGLGATGATVGAAVEFLLADYTAPGTADDYVVADWRFVDLAGLAGARSLGFTLDSTDNGLFGMNTPAYFALDDLVLSRPRAVPAPPAAALLAAGLGLLGAIRRRRAR